PGLCSLVDRFLASIMNKCPRLGNGPAHYNGSWIVGTRITPFPSACPPAETVPTRRGCADRNNHSAVLPAARGRDGAPGSVIHRQIVLCGKGCCVSLGCSRSNGVRDSSAITPLRPHVAHACRTALWRSCGNRVT